MAKKLAVDRWLFTSILLLVGLGLVMVFSASVAVARAQGEGLNPFLVKQGVAAAIGFGLMFGLMHFDYRRLRRPLVVWGGLAVVVAMLVAVLFSPELNASRRWFFLGPLSFQPSETAKLPAGAPQWRTVPPLASNAAVSVNTTRRPRVMTTVSS
jgi:cell division protein FtsW